MKTSKSTTNVTTMAAVAAVLFLLLLNNILYCPSVVGFVVVHGFSVPSSIISSQRSRRLIRTIIRPSLLVPSSSASSSASSASSSLLYLHQSKKEGSRSSSSSSSNDDAVIDVAITVEDLDGDEFPNGLSNNTNNNEKEELYYTLSSSSSSLSSFSSSSMNILMYEENTSNPVEEALFITEDIKLLQNKISKRSNPVDEAFMNDIKLLQNKIYEVKETNTAFTKDMKLKLQSSQISIDELKIDAYELAVQQSLPKKKPISLHSFISSMSVMSSFVLLLPTFHPGIDEYGLPQIFNYEYASYDLLWQSQLCAVLQMTSSIMGIFRLPKRSPNVRTAGFLISALIITQLSLIVISSLNGTSVYLFDAFSIQGRILISVINTALVVGSFNSLTLIVGDKEQKGWDTVPNYSSKTSAFLAVLPFHLLICTLGNAVLPVLGDSQSFTEAAVPFFHIFPGVQTIGYVAISLSTGLGALLATLQYEKKISMEFASFWNIMLLLFFQLDGIKFMYNLNKYPNRFDHSDYFTTYTPHLQSIWHTNELLFIGTILALIIGLKNLSDSVLAISATAAASAAKDAVTAAATTAADNALELAAKYESSEVEFRSLYGSIEDMNE